MLHWTPILNSYDKVRFIQFDDFLASRGVTADAVWVGPADELTPSYVSPSRVCITYSQDPFGRTAPSAQLHVFMSGKQVQTRSSLSNALGLLAFLFDTPDNYQTFTAVDPDMSTADVIQTLGVRFDDFLTPKVGQYMPGEHLAKMQSTWRYYLVEDYGEVVPLADCELAAPLVAWAWADQESERTDLSSRLAKFIPPNSAQIIAG